MTSSFDQLLPTGWFAETPSKHFYCWTKMTSSLEFIPQLNRANDKHPTRSMVIKLPLISSSQNPRKY